MNSTANSAAAATSNTPTFGTVIRTAAIAGGIAATVNAALWIIGSLFANIVVPLPFVVVFSLVFIVLGGVFYWVLSRFLGARTNRVFIIVAVVFLLLNALAPVSATMQPPPGVPLFNTATLIVTELMHIVAGVIAIRRLTGVGR